MSVRHLSLSSLIASAWLAVLAAPVAAAETLVPQAHLTSSGDFVGRKGKVAADVSGLACMPGPSGTRRCLLINDEGGFAQFAQLAENRITPGATLPIIGSKAAPETLGRAPTGLCRKAGGFAELDGEAVTYADGAFYIAGSHGCSRNKGEFRLSAFHLARLKVDAAGQPAGTVELTYRLSDLLRQAGPAAPFFGKALMQENGLNLEGIAVAGDTLWAGLRAPSLRQRAFLVGGTITDLFASGNEPAKSAPQVVEIEIGADRGIRDLAALADGRLLALTGPAQEQDLPFEIVLVDPKGTAGPRNLGALHKLRGAKAESITVLAETGQHLEVLIGYDGPRNGGFELYRLPVQP
jgi:hypothetical protein